MCLPCRAHPHRGEKALAPLTSWTEVSNSGNYSLSNICFTIGVALAQPAHSGQSSWRAARFKTHLTNIPSRNPERKLASTMGHRVRGWATWSVLLTFAAVTLTAHGATTRRPHGISNSSVPVAPGRTLSAPLATQTNWAGISCYYLYACNDTIRCVHSARAFL
jgi:hypothetical protein